jgi:lambda family phage portal protein
MPRDQHLDHLLGTHLTGLRRHPDGPRAGYDAAKTTDENRKHWQEADDLSARSELTPEIRRILRARARYEVKNNCYAGGAVRTLVNDTIGRGPRLRMLTPDKALNAAVQDMWRDWVAATDFALNMRVLCGVRYVAGECFGVFRDSKKLEREGHPITLDIRLIEPDQVSDPFHTWIFSGSGDDGILTDEDGEVIGYRILRGHPGDVGLAQNWGKADTVAANNAFHWIVPERPGQLRGVTPFQPALPIFAQLRRFTTATLTAAEIAAMIAGIMTQDMPPGDAYAETIDKWTTIELVRGTLLALPPGAKAEQFKPEHPTTNYEMFVSAKLRECGRALSMPFGKIAGDHSRYNYSSGRLDDAPYWTDREIERQAFEAKILKPIFYKWLDFARFAIPQLAAFQGQFWQLKHVWHYDARPTSDTVKDATGDELNLTNGTDTPQAICERDGTTLEESLDQRAEAMAMYIERGLPLPPWLAGTPAPPRETVERAPEVPTHAA